MENVNTENVSKETKENSKEISKLAMGGIICLVAVQLHEIR